MSARVLERPSGVVAAGVLATAAVLLLSLCVGVIHVPCASVVAALVDAAAGRPDASLTHTLVLEMRLPRALGALCVGGSLGCAGCMLQALLRDPLASPTLIGTAQAAGFGRVLGVFLGLPYAASVGLAFVFALAGTLLVLAVARSRRGFPSQLVLLTGVNVGMLFAALIGLVQFASRDEGQLSRMVLMLLGGLWQLTWAPLQWVAPLFALAVALTLLLARSLDVLALGEQNAQRLGLATASTGTVVLLLACLLTSLAVSIAGIVAFVGLIVPHAARKLVGPAHAVLLPASAFLGASLLLAIDCLARSALAPNELPLGVLTSLIGVPCFLAILRSLARKQVPA